MQEILKCENITKTYQNLQVVDNVTLDLKQGEILGLAGASGCGKTTLALILLGLLLPNKGNVYYKNKNIRKLRKKELKHFREKVQIIYQDSYASLDPKNRIYNALLEPINIHHTELNKTQKDKIIHDVLNDVNLSEDCLDKYPRQLSGGQRQRISIARAIINKPEIVVCDEIVSSLDVSIQNQILNLIKELNKKHGITFVFISHDMSVLNYISNRIIKMKDGRIIRID